MTNDEHPILKRMRRWLNDPRCSTADWEARKAATRDLNSILGVEKVKEAVERGQGDRYAEMMDEWGKK